MHFLNCSHNKRVMGNVACRIMGDVLSLLVYILSQACCQQFFFLFLHPSTIFMTYPGTISRSYGAGRASIGLRLNPLYLKPYLLLYLYSPFHVLPDTLLLLLPPRSIFFCLKTIAHPFQCPYVLKLGSVCYGGRCYLSALF